MQLKLQTPSKNAPLNGYISLDEPVNSADDNADMNLVKQIILFTATAWW